MFKNIIKFSQKNRKSLIKMFWVFIIVLIGFFLLTVFITKFENSWKQLGDTSARLAAFTFCLVLLPGIVNRFKIKGVVFEASTLVTLFRRQVGILAYIFVLMHFLWSTLLLKLQVGDILANINIIEITGMIAFVLLTPLFLTSNDISIKKMGRKWKALHKIGYVIIWLVFIHLAVQNLSSKGFITIATTGLILLTAVIELISIISYKLKQKKVANNNSNNVLSSTDVRNQNIIVATILLALIGTLTIGGIFLYGYNKRQNQDNLTTPAITEKSNSSSGSQSATSGSSNPITEPTTGNNNTGTDTTAGTNNTGTGTNTGTNTTGTVNTGTGVKTYTTSDVAKHAKSSDCYMIIEKDVYDFTLYIRKHPGGSQILRACGKDGTSMFANLPHSSYAWSLLPPYKIGVLQ